jgi:hypothetical protein
MLDIPRVPGTGSTANSARGGRAHIAADPVRALAVWAALMATGAAFAACAGAQRSDATEVGSPEDEAYAALQGRWLVDVQRMLDSGEQFGFEPEDRDLAEAAMYEAASETDLTFASNEMWFRFGDEQSGGTWSIQGVEGSSVRIETVDDTGFAEAFTLLLRGNQLDFVVEGEDMVMFFRRAGSASE